MKLYLLKHIANRWNRYKYIDYIKRVLDNEILICFDKKYHYLIDLSKTKSFIYFIEDISSLTKTIKYRAPFDNMLYTKFKSSDIDNIEAFSSDRVLKLVLNKKHSYKTIQTTLQLEFTGRNTNAIILDDKNIIIEALRHIDGFTTYRAIQSGIELKPLQPHKIKEEEIDIEDIDIFLKDSFIENSQKEIDLLKERAIFNIDKKIIQIKKAFSSLEKDEDIQASIELWSKKANLVLTNAQDIDIYSPCVLLDDVVIDIPHNIISAYQLSEHCFKKSKKHKAIHKNIHMQRENIEQKLLFLERHKSSVKNSNSFDELSFLNTKKNKKNKKLFCEEFIYNGFKIMVGRNSNENAKILQVSKKDDLWLHIKDIPSSHVLIVSKKQQFPLDVIQKAASLCVDMSVSYGGKYVVDYTYRRHIKTQKGSNVLYTNHKSVFVQKETV